MSCITLEDIVNDCARNSGGLANIYVGDMDAIITKTLDPATHTITTFTATEAPINLNIKRKTSNFVEDGAEDFVNGSSVVTTTITAMLHRRAAEKSRALNILTAGQRYLYIIVEDLNGKFWYFDFAQLQTTGEGSGQERADGSKYSVVFVAEASQLNPEIQASVVVSLLATS
jgi:hypothetical protein